MKKYVIIAIVALLGWIVILSLLLEREKKERKRLKENQTTLLNDVSYYRTKDSLSAASVQRLTLTLDEYETHFANQVGIINSLGLKMKRIQSVTTTGTKTETSVRIQVKDSVVIRDSLMQIRLECIKLHTPYLDINGCIEDHIFTGTIMSRDTLTHILHRIPKRWWFIRYGTKAIRMEVVSSNPNTQLTYAKYIELDRNILRK